MSRQQEDELAALKEVVASVRALGVAPAVADALDIQQGEQMARTRLFSSEDPFIIDLPKSLTFEQRCTFCLILGRQECFRWSVRLRLSLHSFWQDHCNKSLRHAGKNEWRK
jgi:hypothetical protein